MSRVTILLQHKGRWDKTGEYVDFCADAIVISTDCTFDDLEYTISKQIRVDTITNHMEIKYKVNATCPAIEIHNDMGVNVYVELKKDKDFGKYPLCITVTEKSFSDAVNANSLIISPRYTEGTHTYAIEDDDTVKLLNDDEYFDDYDETVGIITDPTHEVIAEGQVFENKETIVTAMKHYALRQKFQFKVKRSSSKCYCLKCIRDDCTWVFKSSSLHESGLFKVRKFIDEHSCPLKDRIYELRQASATIIGSIIKHRYINPKREYRPKDIIEDMHKSLGIELPYMKAWRSKEKALEFVRGDPTKSYTKLPSYLYMLLKANPGSIVDLVKDEDDCFMYVFVALYASTKAWEYCRPIVVVDGSFLSAAHKGTFLAATTTDASGSILPLAYAVVDSENDNAWGWFFDRLRLAYGQRKGMCIVSDRNESIIKAASIVYPDVPHYACIWHLWNNIKTKFKRGEEKLHEVFFSMAKAYTVKEFDSCMTKVENMDVRIKKYLYNIGYQRWARAHSTANRGFTMTSNIAESLNAASKDSRDMPVLAFMESMRNLVERWNYNNNEAAKNRFRKLGTKYHDILDTHRKLAVHMTVKPTTNMYTVMHGERKFLVSLTDRTCCCGRFQMDELPCPHAVAVLKSKHIEEEDYASAYYTTEYLLKTYEVPVNPIPDESNWDVPTYISEEVVLPPTGKRPPGRPKKRRYKPSWEIHSKKSKITCGNCGREGHNRATCRNPSTKK